MISLGYPRQFSSQKYNFLTLLQSLTTSDPGVNKLRDDLRQKASIEVQKKIIKQSTNKLLYL